MTVKRLIIISMFSALIVVTTFINIPVPPVNFTLQTLMIVLVGLLLNPLDAFLAVFVYLAVGFIGVPVFTSGGGPQSFLAPTGGFLISFLITAPAVSIFKSKSKNAFKDGIILLIFGFIVVYIIGILMFMFVLKMDLIPAIIFFVPYYIWDIIKLIIAYIIYYFMPLEIIQKHLNGN
ncbi:biotin transporter BioY [Acholeplasma granularum]|uniref:biotin transporter BioY n=1 Tax=Acholeplasma granularum TaxID=264635 RepID=UPI000471393D|nr:ECF transporter S component [Acholeplasma granularum]